MKTVYLAGPMSGVAGFNYTTFDAAGADWWARGWEVLNPASHFGGDTTRPYEDYLGASVLDVVASDAIALLPGWWDSYGANLELLVARSLGLEVYTAAGERFQTPPSPNFQRLSLGRIDA